MTFSVENQATIFIVFIVCGVLIGVLFDIFRISRKLIPSGLYLTFIQDLLFCLCSFILLILFSYKFNFGQLRWYMFFGIIIGCLLYFITISKFVILISVFIIKISVKILLIPIKTITKIFKKPLFIIIKFGKIHSCRIKNKILPFKKYINMLKKRKNMV